MPLTPEEAKEVLSKPFELLPDCRCEHYCKPRGYKKTLSEDQKKIIKIPHKHGIDIVCGYGGTQSAKTVTGIYLGIDYALRYPGVTILVGARTREILKRTAMKGWEERFTINESWDHPYVFKKPNDHQKSLVLKVPYKKEDGSIGFKLSTIWFLHFSDFKTLRGMSVSFVHIEEASLIDASDVMKELNRRCTSTYAPQRMIYLSTNPEERKGWIHETFSMKQDEPGYEGPKIPRGRPCNCHLCQSCFNKGLGELEFVNGRCPNPNCEIGLKPTECPGNVEFMRIVFLDASRNPHVPPDYIQSNKSLLTDVEANLYIGGQVIELDQSRVYEHFDAKKNIRNVDQSLDFAREMVWSFDFNNMRQCSVICQEREVDGGIEIDVIDEIVVPPSVRAPNKIKLSPSFVGKEFLFRYPTYNQLITLHGDPAALNDRVGDNDISLFQMVYDVITNPRDHLTPQEYEEFLSLGGVAKRVRSMPVKIVGQTKIMVKTKVNSTNMKLVDGTGRPWVFINPKCGWLTLSLDSLKWADLNRTAIDVTVDKKDRKNPNKDTVRLVSHISDALGYYLAKKWPVHTDSNNAYAFVPGETSIEMINGKMVETSARSNMGPTSEAEKKIAELELQNALMRSTPAKSGSMLELIQGSWGEEESTVDFGFW